MIAEQLEELLEVMDNGGESRADAEFHLKQLTTSLARRVIAAEKLVEALDSIPLGDGPLARLVAAYREACK